MTNTAVNDANSTCGELLCILHLPVSITSCSAILFPSKGEVTAVHKSPLHTHTHMMPRGRFDAHCFLPLRVHLNVYLLAACPASGELGACTFDCEAGTEGYICSGTCVGNRGIQIQAVDMIKMRGQVKEEKCAFHILRNGFQTDRNAMVLAEAQENVWLLCVPRVCVCTYAKISTYSCPCKQTWICGWFVAPHYTKGEAAL